MDQNLLDRIKTHRNNNLSGKYVAYLMSRDQRVKDNHALIYAQKLAIEKKLPLIVIFNLYPNSGVRAFEHYMFMLDGLRGVKDDLTSLNIPLAIFLDNNHDKLLDFINSNDILDIICDFSPLSGPQKKIKLLVDNTNANIFEVDTHNIIPVWKLSDKQEFAAHTIRRKVHQNLKNYLVEPDKLTKHPYHCTLPKAGEGVDDISKQITSPKRGISISFDSGEQAAAKTLENLKNKLLSYAKDRNNPNLEAQSDLSPYLHFGQISSLRVALDLINHVDVEPLLLREPKMASAGEEQSAEDGLNSLLEEMIVRKELSDNFCYYSKSYKDLSSIPAWAVNTLKEHTSDSREFVYNLSELEHSKTHDPAWNAAQSQLTKTGKMHGYMRMYWAKKMLEWTNSPQEAIDFAMYLNDAYSLDGGDPNGYVGILWSIAGLHDRPWFERPVFGTIRYMNYSGLSRKFDLDLYIKAWT